MLNYAALGLAAGAAVQAWRNYPADGPVQADLALWLFVAGIVVAYCAGRARRKPLTAAVAVAQADAHADAVASATQSVQVLLVNGDAGTRAPAGAASGLEAAPWLVGGTTPELHALVDESVIESVVEDGGMVEDVSS